MPLKQGYSKKTVSKNIATEVNAGRDPKQAAAIAFATARKAKRDGYSLRNADWGGEDVPSFKKKEMKKDGTKDNTYSAMHVGKGAGIGKDADGDNDA